MCPGCWSSLVAPKIQNLVPPEKTSEDCHCIKVTEKEDGTKDSCRQRLVPNQRLQKWFPQWNFDFIRIFAMRGRKPMGKRQWPYCWGSRKNTGRGLRGKCPIEIKVALSQAVHSGIIISRTKKGMDWSLQREFPAVLSKCLWHPQGPDVVESSR